MAKATPDALSQPDTRKSIDQHRYTAMATALWAAKHGKSPTDAGLKQPTPAETRRIKEAIYNWRVVIGGLGHCMCHTVARAKARLRQFQSMISSTHDSETSLAMGMLRLAQRWGGAQSPSEHDEHESAEAGKASRLHCPPGSASDRGAARTGLQAGGGLGEQALHRCEDDALATLLNRFW